jgi:hypothetical protein
MTDDEADAHVAAAARRWAEQSGRTWTLDLSMLTDAGVTLTPPDEPATRVEVARRYCSALKAGPAERTDRPTFGGAEAPAPA